MKLLTICIPTYNRNSHLISQLKFLQKEILPFTDLIEIKVADNCSDKIHQEAALEYQKQNPFFELYCNKENLGLIGNFYYLLSLSKSKYIWFVGDDDVLLDGVIKRIIDILSENSNLFYLFLNHNIFFDNPEKSESRIDLCNYEGYVENGKECIIDLFNKNGPINMFMTSCIYPIETLNELLMVKREKLIVDPLLFSFFSAATNKMYVIKEVYVLDRYVGATWSNQAKSVGFWLVPYVISELEMFNYSKNEVFNLVNMYYLNNKGYYIRMLMNAPQSYKTKIKTVLESNHLFVLISSLIFNIKRVILKPFEGRN